MHELDTFYRGRDRQRPTYMHLKQPRTGAGARTGAKKRCRTAVGERVGIAPRLRVQGSPILSQPVLGGLPDATARGRFLRHDDGRRRRQCRACRSQPRNAELPDPDASRRPTPRMREGRAFREAVSQLGMSATMVAGFHRPHIGSRGLRTSTDRTGVRHRRYRSGWPGSRLSAIRLRRLLPNLPQEGFPSRRSRRRRRSGIVCPRSRRTACPDRIGLQRLPR